MDPLGQGHYSILLACTCISPSHRAGPPNIRPLAPRPQASMVSGQASFTLFAWNGDHCRRRTGPAAARLRGAEPTLAAI